MTGLWQDLRYAGRSLVRNPGFALAAILTLAIGIGANTAIFSVVHGVLLRPLPFAEPERLIGVWGHHVTIGRETASLPDFLDWRRQSRAVEDMAAFTNTRYNLTGEGEPEVLRGAVATSNLLPLLGLVPGAGRGFTAAEERAEAARVVMLSDGFWRRRFGGRTDVLGRQLSLSGVPHTVVGIAPPALRLQQEVDVWTPLVTDTTLGRRSDFLTVIGRLRAGTTLAKAQQELTTIAGRLAASYPATNAGWGVELLALQEQMVGGIRPALLVFMGAVALVLLIACANVANLMLARVASREREVTIRTALGASRARVARQLLTESAVVALAGGTAGLLLAVWGVQALRTLEPGTIPRASEIGIDPVALGFALALSILTGLLFGLLPALRVLRRDPHAGLQGSSRGATGGVSAHHTRSALVLVEVALAFMLLIGAALLLRSFGRLQDVDPGFTGEGILTARLSFPRNAYPEPQQRLAFGDRLVERLRATPGVQAAALVSDAPVGGSAPYWAFSVQGVEPPAAEVVQDATVFATGPGYFGTIGIPLLEGRLITAADGEDAPPVAVVGQALARRYWPDRSPVGARITFGDPADTASTWVTIVGVVGDVRQESLAEPPYPQVYLPFAQMPVRSIVILARGPADPLALLPAFKRAVGELDPGLPLAEVATIEQMVTATLARPRVNAALLGGFALVALALAAVGIYGVITYGVIQRTRELGIRMALGAGRDQLLRLVVRQGMLPVLAGVALGAAGALLAGRMLRSLLYGVGAADPVAFAVVTGFLLAVALLASYLPARRAARTDPMVALRND